MNPFRGWIGEKKTAFYLWLSLPGKSYHTFHNIILPSKNGTTQIDHLIVSIFGIFIVETKNKRGWIFGEEKQPAWTQLIYRKKYSFQNPLRQAFRQKKVLSESSISNRNHIKSLRERHASNTICPRCGSNLVARIANSGSNAGTKFLGCENYPKCQFTKSAN